MSKKWRTAYSLLLQAAFPDVTRRYHRGSNDDQVLTYLLIGDVAIQVRDDVLTLYGSEEQAEQIERQIRRSIDRYHSLGQPPLTDYSVLLQERKAMVRVGEQCFSLPLLLL